MPNTGVCANNLVEQLTWFLQSKPYLPPPSVPWASDAACPYTTTNDPVELQTLEAQNDASGAIEISPAIGTGEKRVVEEITMSPNVSNGREQRQQNDDTFHSTATTTAAQKLPYTSNNGAGPSNQALAEPLQGSVMSLDLTSEES